MKWINTALVLILATLATTATLASQPTQAKWYAVEVIVFQPTADTVGNKETWPATPSLPNLDDSVVPTASTRYTRSTKLTQIVRAAKRRTHPSKVIIALPSTDYTLDSLWEKLDDSGRYDPLLHTGWIQLGVAPSHATRVSITRLLKASQRAANNAVYDDKTDTAVSAATITRQETRYNPNQRVAPLDGAAFGTIALSDGDYLRLVLDIAFRPHNRAVLQTWHSADIQTTNSRQTSAALAPRALDSSANSDLNVQRQAPMVIGLTGSRRVKAGEINYFDNPLFGVIVQVTKIDSDAKD